MYFDPENIVKLAIEGGCNAVASTFGVLGAVARKYAHKIPFMVKLNHNEFLTYPNKFDQIMFAQRRAGVRHGRGRRSARRFTSAPTSRRGRSRKSRRRSRRRTSWAWSPCSGATCATRRSRRRTRITTSSADLTGQANHLGVTIEADIIKQKLPENNGGYNALHRSFGKTDKRVYTELTPGDHPIELTPLPGGQLLHGPHRR